MPEFQPAFNPADFIEEETLTIPRPITALSNEGYFELQDSLRTKYKNLQKFILKEFPVGEDREKALLELNNSLGSLIVALTKRLKGETS